MAAKGTDEKLGFNGPNGRKATLKTIADLTGLSLSTVSLSLRGGAAVKEETRRKVAEAARLVGYVPDRAGVRLRTGKTNVVALVLDGRDEAVDFAGRLIQGIGHALKNTAYHLVVTPEFGPTTSLDSIRYILDSRTADGVIITHTTPRDKRVQLLMESGFPFVANGRTRFATPHAYHDYHSEDFASLAVRRLVSLGRSNILLLLGDQRTTNYHNIANAFRHTTDELGVTGHALGGAAAGKTTDFRDLGQDLASRPDRPDGIICDSELRAIALISGFQAGGLMLRRDIDVVCKQTSGILASTTSDVDSVEEDVFAAGVELTRLLLRRIEGEAPESLQTLGEPVLHWRD